MSETLRAAAVQMTSSDDVSENLGMAAELIAQAARERAQLVVLPENFAFMGKDETARLAHTEVYGDTAAPIQRFLRRAAREHELWLAGGTIALGTPGAKRACASMLVYGPDGCVACRYDKIHLFDVDLPGGTTTYRESAATLAGTDAVVGATGAGRLGLAVCYDLRFPELFRTMMRQGPDVFAVCAAFTVPTGAAHWATLVRARAIENLTGIVAAAQGGAHAAGRETYGYSMIVDAWGRVLATQPSGPGVIVADIDLAEQRLLRQSFPVLAHRRMT